MVVALIGTLLTIIFSIFATAVMSYISLAVPIGPWIETTLVLLALIVFRCVSTAVSRITQEKIIALSTVGAGITGIIGSACAWSFPTLFFLDPVQFNFWMNKPVYFCAMMGVVVFAAGGLGLVVMRFFEKSFFSQGEAMPFPVAQLVHKMITVQQQIKKSYELVAGAVSAIAFGALQMFTRLIPNKVVLLQKCGVLCWQVPQLTIYLDVVPMLWAIGFITGHVMAIPLLVGALSKIVLLDPLHGFFFASLSSTNFLLAFCSGMVVYGALLSFIDVPRLLFVFVKNIRNKKMTPSRWLSGYAVGSWSIYEVIGIAALNIATLTFFGFSFLGQLYVLVGTGICAYYLMMFMGKAGLAPLGRYATFVVVPGLFLFGFSAVQVTLAGAMVEIAGGVAADSLSGCKVGSLMGIDSHLVRRYQWKALLVCALIIGIIFWLLINHFGLGSSALLAQRAQSRALLLTAYQFDITVILLGVIFGWLLKYSKVSAPLVFGGLLMPLDWSLILILSGCSTYLFKNKESHYPWWSGVFAASSLWMICKALL